MKPFVFHFFKVIVIAFVIMEAMCFLLMFTFRETMFYKTNIPHVKAGAHFGFVILGSSRGLTSFDTGKMSKKFGQTGFNFSVDDTHVGSHLLMMKHLLHEGVTMDTVFLVYENANIKVPAISANDYRFAPFIFNDYVREYYAEKDAPFYLRHADYLPFISFSYYNVELLIPSLFAAVKPNYRYRYTDLGDYDYPVTQHVQEDARQTRQPVHFGNEELAGFRDLCDKHNIKLFVVLTPNYGTTYEYLGNHDGFDIIDMAATITGERYFYDRIHLNKEGKHVLTDALIERLEDRAGQRGPDKQVAEDAQTRGTI